MLLDGDSEAFVAFGFAVQVPMVREQQTTGRQSVSSSTVQWNSKMFHLVSNVDSTEADSSGKAHESAPRTKGNIVAPSRISRLGNLHRSDLEQWFDLSKRTVKLDRSLAPSRMDDLPCVAHRPDTLARFILRDFFIRKIGSHLDEHSVAGNGGAHTTSAFGLYRPPVSISRHSLRSYVETFVLKFSIAAIWQ